MEKIKKMRDILERIKNMVPVEKAIIESIPEISILDLTKYDSFWEKIQHYFKDNILLSIMAKLLRIVEQNPGDLVSMLDDMLILAGKIEEIKEKERSFIRKLNLKIKFLTIVLGLSIGSVLGLTSKINFKLSKTFIGTPPLYTDIAILAVSIPMLIFSVVKLFLILTLYTNNFKDIRITLINMLAVLISLVGLTYFFVIEFV